MKKVLAVALLVAGALAHAQMGNNAVGTINQNFVSFDFPLAGVTDTEATAITHFRHDSRPILYPGWKYTRIHARQWTVPID
jgi:hypothetical protein